MVAVFLFDDLLYLNHNFLPHLVFGSRVNKVLESQGVERHPRIDSANHNGNAVACHRGNLSTNKIAFLNARAITIRSVSVICLLNNVERSLTGRDNDISRNSGFSIGAFIDLDSRNHHRHIQGIQLCRHRSAAVDVLFTTGLSFHIYRRHINWILLIELVKGNGNLVAALYERDNHDTGNFRIHIVSLLNMRDETVYDAVVFSCDRQ